MQRLKNFIYNLIQKLAIAGDASTNKQTLLIVKIDEIGDYVLWRNMLTCFRQSERFRNYKITLCGNEVWKDLTLTFDNKNFDNFIWLNKKKFKSDMRYRYDFLKSVYKCGFEIVINPVFSRSPRTDDAIVRSAKNSFKIGMVRNSHNVLAFEENADKDLYHELHELPLHGVFEFERNRLFTELATKQSCLQRLQFDQNLLPALPVIISNYAVIFPGSGRKDRKWSIKNFKSIAEFLHHSYKLNIVIAGGKSDEQDCAELESILSFTSINICAKTSLPQFVSLLNKASCLVSVDTGSVHLAAASGCTVYGLFNGSQYGRFSPYPEDITRNSFYSIYPDEITNQEKNQNFYTKYQYYSSPGYNDISPEKVIKLISETLKIK